MPLRRGHRWFSAPPPMWGMGDIQADLPDLLKLLQSGNLNPTFLHPTYKQNTPGGVMTNPVGGFSCVDDASAARLAAAAGAQVVKRTPQAIAAVAVAGTTPLCNFLQFPDGSVVDAGDIAYYSTAGPALTADVLTGALNAGAQQASYDQSYLQQVSQGVVPQYLPTSQPENYVRPAVQPITPAPVAAVPSVQMPGEVQPVPAGVSPLPSLPVPQVPAVPTSTGVTSWLSGSSVAGLPNWALVAAGVGLVFLMGRR